MEGKSVTGTLPIVSESAAQGKGLAASPIADIGDPVFDQPDDLPLFMV